MEKQACFVTQDRPLNFFFFFFFLIGNWFTVPSQFNNLERHDFTVPHKAIEILFIEHDRYGNSSKHKKTMKYAELYNTKRAREMNRNVKSM